ncbi:MULTISPECIES: hypothetical protein [Bacillus cereus group]|uniref:Uncharacterized protein n=2 Tax=Bacillus cereus group TaxID=86661 RepID=A0A9X7GU64_BACCE|nr:MULTISPECIES: hypothetical protein [Bacillus cereus group]ALL11792.1 hypothetical protein BTXL6_28470 [Bacillus thuringiensis]ALL21930.1 hypothetical protein BTXL6_10905 [Bacillus thuringiensis]MEB9673885.1 hypothetical protein [Bacillus anthracis]OTW50928.1 hypothetical protein BK699_10325 [Bacillus thuringiensis serovar mexicanensis]OTX09613.1 hypothetical protein BK705_05370 [Bacillus thuringiensis serovar monterrey]
MAIDMQNFITESFIRLFQFIGIVSLFFVVCISVYYIINRYTKINLSFGLVVGLCASAGVWTFVLL